MAALTNFFLPAIAHNCFKGPSWILYVFYGFAGLMLWRSQHHIFSSDGGSSSIAGIPIDSFVNGGAESVTGLFAQWGVSQLLLAIIFLVVALRYRALIPLMFLIAWVENLFRLGAGIYKPIGAVDPPGFILTVVVLIGVPLILVICSRSHRNPRKSTKTHSKETPVGL